MMHRVLLLLCLLTLPLKGQAKEDPTVQCEMLLENYGNLQLGTQIFHEITVGHDFKIYFGQGSASLFKALGLSGLTQQEYENLHVEIAELSPRLAKKKDADYILRLYLPKKQGRRLITELPYKAPPLFARGRTDATRKQFEDYMRSENFDFDQMEPNSIEGYHLSVHLNAQTQVPLYLMASLEDGKLPSIEIGAYQSCRQSLGQAEDVEPIRTRDGWLCAVPILRFLAPEIQIKKPASIARAVSTEKH